MAVRRLLLAVLLIGMIGTGVELVLLEHYEYGWQYVPFGALAVGLVASLAALIHPVPFTVRGLQLVMVGFVWVGVLGLWRHLEGNMEFELERHPELGGAALVWQALRGATPTLAPGTFVQLGLLGLIAMYRHPRRYHEVRLGATHRP